MASMGIKWPDGARLTKMDDYNEAFLSWRARWLNGHDGTYDPEAPIERFEPFGGRPDIQTLAPEQRRRVESYRRQLEQHPKYNPWSALNARGSETEVDAVLRSCKFGLVNDAFDRVVFVVDGIETEATASKNGRGKSVTSSELRRLFREWVESPEKTKARAILSEEGRVIDMDAYFRKPEWSEYETHVRARQARRKVMEPRLQTIESASSILQAPEQLRSLVDNNATRVAQLKHAKTRENDLLALNILRAHYGLEPLNPLSHGLNGANRQPAPAKYYVDMLDQPGMAPLALFQLKQTPSEDLAPFLDEAARRELREFLPLPARHRPRTEGVRRALAHVCGLETSEVGGLTEGEKKLLKYRLELKRWSASVFRDPAGDLAIHVNTLPHGPQPFPDRDPVHVRGHIREILPRIADDHIHVDEPDRLKELQEQGRFLFTASAPPPKFIAPDPR